jgi:hypothetical protein
MAEPVSPERQAVLRVLEQLRHLGTGTRARNYYSGPAGRHSPAQAGGAIDPAAGTIGRPLDNHPAYQAAQQRTEGIAQNMVGQEVAAEGGEGGVPGGLPGGSAVEGLVAQVIQAVFGWSDYQSQAAAPQGAQPPGFPGGAGGIGQNIDPRMIQMLLQQAQWGQSPQGGPGQAMVPPNFDNQIQQNVPQPAGPPPGATEAAVPPGFDNQTAAPAPPPVPPPGGFAPPPPGLPPGLAPPPPGAAGPQSAFDPRMMAMLMAQARPSGPPGVIG